MRYRVHIIIKGQVESVQLWRKIAKYPVNLLDVGDTTWVYGEIEDKDTGALLKECSEFGYIDASIQS